MTRESLEQLIDLHAEIGELAREIEKLEERGTKITMDKVQASSKEWPYMVE